MIVRRSFTRGTLAALGMTLALATATAALLAQGRRGGRGAGGGGVVGATDFEVNNVGYDARYVFVRLRFTPSRTQYEGGDNGYFGGIDYFWNHDYPTADRHFTTITRELTSIQPSHGTNIIAIGSPELMKYPVAYVSEPGWWTQTDEEAANLRAYLQKGGFLIFDDFVGQQHLANLDRQLRRVLPDAQLVQLPPTHPIFNSFFAVDPATQQSTYRVQPYFLGVFEDNDPSKRLLLIANLNNDIGDAWEWSDQGFIPIDITNEAFKLGVNYLIYAMTH